MTVAVSTVVGGRPAISILPELYPLRDRDRARRDRPDHVANLRGLRESGNIFAIPTYLFVGLALAIVGIGVCEIVTGEHRAVAAPGRRRCTSGTEPIGLFLLLRAFASGSVALTGTEAIANGVPAFKPPEARNAATTMVVDGGPAGGPVRRHHDRGASAYEILPSEEGRAARRSSPSWPRPRSASARRSSTSSRSHRADPVPRREHELQRVSRASGRCSRRTATCPASSRFRGDRLAFSWGIVLLAGRRRRR